MSSGIVKRWCLWLLLLMGLMPGVVQAGGYETTLPDADSTRVEITFRSFTDTVPSRGWAEVEVEIRNRMTQSDSWRFQFASQRGWQEQNRLTHVRVVEVPPQSVRTVRLEVPVYPPIDARTYWRNSLDVRVLGPGCKGREHLVIPQGNTGHSGDPGFSVAVSDEVRVSRTDNSWNWNTLTKEVRDQNIPLEILEMDLGVFPLGEKGLMGMDALLMTEGEWETLRPHHQNIRRWVAQGGHLILYADQEAPVTELGLGTIRTSVLYSRDMVKTAREFTRLPARHIQAEQGQSFYEKRWPLRNEVPDLKRPVAGLVLAVIVIAAVLGPVNLGVALRRRNAFQVLWTTPVLSVGISLLLGLAILLGDGVGGKGARIQWTLLVPGERLAFTWQEQVSRTGVIPSSRVTLPQGWWMQPVPTQSSDRNTDRTYALQADGTHTGDWFANRRVQAQILQHSGISRSRVERSWQGSTPRLTSTLEQTLVRIFYRDERGDVWTAQKVVPGQPTLLRRASSQEETFFFREMRLRKQSLFPGNDALKRQNWFYAELKDPDAWVDTLRTIRWENQSQWILGPVVEGTP